MVKNLPTMWEAWVRSLGWEDPLEEGVATHSSILAWRIPWTEGPHELQSMGSQRVGHDWVTKHSTWLFSGSWSWSSNTLATWCEEPTEKTLMLGMLKAGGEGGERGWDGWMASLTEWTRVWASSGSWWRTGKPGVLLSMGSQRVTHNWATEQQQQAWGWHIWAKIGLLKSCTTHLTVK